MSELMRVDKFLSDMCVGTRKEIKNMAKNGRIKLNGAVIKSTDIRINPLVDKITLDEKEIAFSKFEYYMLYKPQGVVSATSDASDKTVIDLIRENSEDTIRSQDLFPVGRLDKDTEGLLLITNDGELAHRLLSPSKHVDKIYYAVIDGIVTEEDVRSFAQGITLKDGTVTKPSKLRILKVLESEQITEIEVTLYEGRYHQVKRMFAACGKHVAYLKRISMGKLQLDEGLRPGQFRALTNTEIALLTESTAVHRSVR